MTPTEAQVKQIRDAIKGAVVMCVNETLHGKHADTNWYTDQAVAQILAALADT